MLHSSYRKLLLYLLFLALFGCSQSNEDTFEKKVNSDLKENITTNKKCFDCHPYSLDANHNFECTVCHKGRPESKDKDSAHVELISQPASPSNMVQLCGRCHTKLVEHIAKSKHFTLSDEVNLVRQAFGAFDTINNPQLIPQAEKPENILDLVDDLLRRRCLRCHVYSAGDQYPAVTHGTGCAACHLKFNNGALVSHEFIKLPDDQICLSCHYGNYVGSDYFGLYEHDFNWEYQTPFSPKKTENLPFGLNYHKLRPDIHQTAGIACIDCHNGDEIMGLAPQVSSCSSCHLINPDSLKQNSNIKASSSKTSAPLTLKTKISKEKIVIPQITKDHHKKNISCQVCHAQWSFFDYGTHLYRLDEDFYAPWLALTKQGSSEVEQLLEYNLFYDNDETSPFMIDKLTGKQKSGVWLKGFELRRWEEIPTCLDDNDILQVCRPILDLHLTYVDQNGDTVFNSVLINSSKKKLVPYSPHTIGKADIFKTKKYLKN